ncbi:acyl-CoA-binding domain-containing protein 4 [Coffea eugenioides]|uniref:acyl-CoA-binding domain-containing protein 4 n=1 Tax=Coffea eugenioides TaxID=49369 RepID=UPI000F605CBF|nr:acyl-CoA-binding domain-containing protein 4 [Coffea eugenioides]XP_027161186.1 acyl-CoA-binding domain-containing protein 4 [Coffea eugenioides]
MGTDNQNWHLNVSFDQWVAVPVPGPRPAARYKHAATVVDEKLYISGGSRNGRYLSDVQAFDLKSLTWSTVKLKLESNAVKMNDGIKFEGLPAIAGHSMIKWENKLLLLAGHSKHVSDGVTVRFIDLETHNCGVIETYGKVPVARGGQSVTLVGSKLVMFGGEDRNRRLLNDVRILDLETMTWSSVETTQTPPAPRFDHAAALHTERYLLISGGCSHSVFFSDLHVLDLETMQWSQPQIHGDLMRPRAGHAGVTLDEDWYIVGGGDNRSGAPDTLLLDMSKLAVSVLTSVKGREPLASEGLSVSSAVLDTKKFLVAFGGYNGKYNNEVFVMRPKLKDNLLPKIFQSPAAAAAAASVTAAYALTKSEKLDLTEREDSNFKVIQVDHSQQDLSVEISSIREEKRLLELSLKEVRSENSSLKAKIEEINGTHAELSKELQSVQGQLVDERSRCAKLEALIAELQKNLESLQPVEEEVQILRKQKDEFEREMELAAASAQRQNSGVWRWIAG